MKRKQLTVLLLLLLSLTALAEQPSQKQIPTMVVGQVAQGQIYKVERYKNYHLISVPQLDKKYLFFTLRTEQIYQHLNLSLTVFKQGAQTPLVTCLKQEIDSCYIPKENLKQFETLFAVVQCDSEQELQYKLRVYWSDLEHIAIGADTKFMFSEREQRQIYHLQLEGKEFKELRIIIKPETRRYAFDKIKMYGTYGPSSTPSAQHHDFKSFPLWEDAEGVYLFRSEIKQLSINLILYGVTETVYTMRCDLVNSTHSELALNSKIYQYLEDTEKYTYHMEFKDAAGKYFYENFVFRVSVFSGNLDFKFYKDENKKQPITDLVNPYVYMGDTQYLLKQATIDKLMPNGLFISAESTNRVSTFMLEFEGRSKSQVIELHEHIYEFLRVEKQELAYFRVGRFGKQKSAGDALKVTFTMISVEGEVATEFRICNKPQNDCLGKDFANNTQKISTEVRQVGSKTTHTLSLDSTMFSNINIVEQHALIVVVLNNHQQSQGSFAAVQFNVGNRPEFLRQNKPIESHVRKQQLKIYKYVCQDPSVKKLKVHINQISGCFSTYAFRRQPTADQLTADAGKVKGSLIEITEKLLEEPLVIVISGVDSATYSIVVQPIVEDNQEMSFITLSEDVEFKIKIAANKYEIFQIVPVASNIYFTYKATGSMHACRLNQQNICTNDTRPVLQNSGSITIEKFYDRKAYIRIRNPSSRVVEVTAIFHSKTNDHCELIKMGQLASEVLTEGKCIYTVIDALEDFEVMLVHQQYGKFKYNMLLCDKVMSFARKENNEQRFLVTKDQLKTSCQGHSEYSFAFFVLGDISRWQSGKPAKVQKLNVKYIVQYVNSIIALPDGVGYHSSQVTVERPIKRFAYKLLNMVDTTIVLSTNSRLYFLVKVVESAYKDKVTMSLDDFHFSSPVDRFYFLDSIFLKITTTQLQKSSCAECDLLIYLYSQQQVGQIVDFTLQVTQNFQMLEQGRSKKNYLTQNSMAYYSYKAKSKGKILVQSSDNNLNCAQLYISHNEYPSENDYDKRAFDGQLILDNNKEEPTTYYISVKARVNCAYSIATILLTGERSIRKLQRGILSALTLSKGEVKYFTFRHMSESPFKILSLHKYGSVDFYLNETNPEDVGTLMQQKTVNYQNFKYHSDQKNRLLLGPGNINFCKGCFYLLAAYANKITDSSLYLGDQQTKIPISEDKVINDILPDAGSYTRGEFYPMEQGVLEVKVHSGKLQVNIQYKDQSFKQVFEKTDKKVEYNFTLNIVPGYYHTASAIFRAQTKNTVYSLRIISLKNNIQEETGNDYTLVNPSQANYFYVDGSRPSCLKGFLKGADERLFVSFYSENRKLVDSLKITAQLDGKPTNISLDISRNVMSVAFIEAHSISFVKGLSYEVCLSLDNQTMSMIAMQTDEASLLPENVEMLVTGKQTYDIYPQGQFLLDIFQCRGTASLAYGSSRSELQSKKQKILDTVGMPDQPHAVKIEQGYSNMLISVNSPLALVRWLPIKAQQQKGVGYYLFSAGTLKYDSSFGVIEFIVQPLKGSGKKTKTKISNIKYNLYVSNNQQDLKEASLCERYLPESVIEYKTIHQQIFTSSFKFSIDKNKLISKYKEAENLFAVIVADLTLNTPDKSEQNYRFVYNQQEIPAQIFTPSKLEQFNYVLLIVFLVVLVIAMVVFAWLCTKVIVPMIGRLKNRVLVEEHGLDNSKDKDIEIKDENLEPPPSSDRQTLQTGPQTEVKMG